jgi:hypothetical protein
MNLTTEQKAALKAHILANQDTAFPYTEGNLPGVADLLNLAASPEYVVWKTAVSDAEIMQNGFDWTRVDNLSVGKARVWDWMFRFGTVDPSKANVRAGIDQTWQGTVADLAVRAAVYVHCKRAATRLEQLFASGGGSTASPSTMAVVGPIGYEDLIGL